MAKIAPFRGIRYNPAKFPRLEVTVAQPYDRITGPWQDRYYERSPYNVVRLSLGKTFDTDTETNNRYTRARDYLHQWLKEGILIQDEQPAFYVYHEAFTLPSGEEKVRKGLIAALELAEFDEGIVLPHERTLSAPKEDRLKLLRAMQTHLGQVFMLYPDPGNKVSTLFDAAINREPDLTATDILETGVIHKMWKVTDPEVLAAVAAEMAPKRNLIIADGHHRYETALNYRHEMRQRTPGWTPDMSFNWVMVTLVSMEDPGLTILPTHRLIHSYERKTAAQALADAAVYFSVEKAADKEAMFTRLSELARQAHAFGFYDGQSCYVLILKDETIMDQVIGPERAREWKLLDVTILHELFIERVLGLSKESVARQENIKYLRLADEGFEAVDAAKAQFLLLLNPTRAEQVAACASQGERMPQKSTDFYPKVLTGLVMMPATVEYRIRA